MVISAPSADLGVPLIALCDAWLFQTRGFGETHTVIGMATVA